MILKVKKSCCRFTVDSSKRGIRTIDLDAINEGEFDFVINGNHFINEPKFYFPVNIEILNCGDEFIENYAHIGGFYSDIKNEFVPDSLNLTYYFDYESFSNIYTHIMNGLAIYHIYIPMELDMLRPIGDKNIFLDAIRVDGFARLNWKLDEIKKIPITDIEFVYQREY